MIQKNLLKILFVEDVPSDVELAVLELRKEKIIFEYTTVCTRIDLVNALREFKPNLIISDYMMPAFNGLQALKESIEFDSELPFILYTGSVNEETAVECIKAGAKDYVIKEHSTRLPFAVKEALEQVRINKEKRASDLLLRENEEKLQSIFSAAPVGIGLLVNRVIIEINDTFCNMTGYSRSELIGKSSEILYLNTEDFLSADKDKYMQILEEGSGSVETKIKIKDGRILNVIIGSAPLTKSDISRGVTFTVLDITERKRMEDALLRTEEQYRRIFENVQDLFYETSIDGIILEVSPSIFIMSKGLYRREELLGRSIFEFYTDPGERDKLVSLLMKQGTASDFEITLKNKDGSLIPCSLSSKIFLDEQGTPEKIIGSIHDITDLKNASDALKLAKEKAETSDRLKTEFLNNISHEVRTPLNGILGFAEIISLHDLSEVEKKDSLAMLFESSNRLLNTITNYMDISLITSGSLSINKKNFNPELILKKIYNNYEPLCLIKKIELVLEIPGQPDSYIINSDPEICQKIISHFMDNAVKFTEKGSIHFGFKINDDQLLFFVRDSGIGINLHSFTTIFDRFVKEGQGPYRVSEGSGLGLSIAKGMAEAIGGKVSLESEPGAGSCFFFSVMMKKETVISNVRTPVADSVGNISLSTILVAEDDDTNFYYLNALITRETGAKVLYASNGREAIELFRTNQDIQLILMDMKMPEIDGFEATRQIKLINPKVKIIAITAYAMSGDEERTIAAGCDGYLSKPLNKKILLEKIAEFIKF
jgi:PAS domain S-box-containing protein